MSENGLWDKLSKGMGAMWEAQRHEDRYSTGIPDVSYSMKYHGWIELKFLKSPPVNADTAMRIKHYTSDQKNWITRHGKRAGLCWILIQVGEVFMLFDWTKARLVGELSFEEHLTLANKYWEGRINFNELSVILNSPIRAV